MTAPRIPPLPVDERDPELQEQFAALRRPDGTDLNIFTTLGRHPKLLKRWSAFGATLLYGGSLSPRDRELLILRTGWNCRSPYEWGQHVEIARQVGMDDDEITRVADGPDAPDWAPEDAALLRAADELHEDNRIGDTTWAALADRFDDRQLIEVCMIVGQYHLVAYTLNSLGVQPEPGLPPLPEQAR